MFFFIIFLTFPIIVYGHSSAISIDPGPNRYLDKSPTQVTITFRHEIDEHLFTLNVFDSNHKDVTKGDPVISNHGTKLMVKLLKLTNGEYTVKYNVISANDGHHQEDTYSFSIGNSSPKKEVQPVGHSSSTHKIEPDEIKLSTNNFGINVFRGFYYLGLLWTIGWVFWGVVLLRQRKTLPKGFERWGITAQMVHLMGLTCMILMQFTNFTESGLMFRPEIPLTSLYALTWMGSLSLSIVGFVLLFKSKWIDALWILLIVMFKALNGHPSEFDLGFVFTVADSIHLIGASIWCSGLIYIMVFWRKQRLHVHTFLPMFSVFAFGSFVALFLTGTMLTIGLLSEPYALFTTVWGATLLIKLTLVIAIVLIGVWIRKVLKSKNGNQIKLLLTLDSILMVTIIAVVSVLTYLSPVP
nr:copper resistance protein CopC [Sporolactobacillus kofuensis]